MDVVEQSSLPVPLRLRVVTYNVFQARYLHPDAPAPGAPSVSVPNRGGRRDERRSLLRDFATLPCLQSADVILLQEALAGTTGTASTVDTVATLARALGVDATPGASPHGTGHTAFHPSVRNGASHWGLGILSRVPARFTPVVLPNAWWSPWPRAALFAEIGPWILVTLHLEVWPVGDVARRRQMQAILDVLGGLPGNSTRPVVLAGDFNCQRGGPHQVMRRNGFDPAPVKLPTWAMGPLALRLDHVYVRNARVVVSGVEDRARGSDHRPLWVDVERAPDPARHS